jgi:hypothetical protein
VKQLHIPDSIMSRHAYPPQSACFYFDFVSKKEEDKRSPFLNGEQEGGEEAQFLWYKKNTALMTHATWKNS